MSDHTDQDETHEKRDVNIVKLMVVALLSTVLVVVAIIFVADYFSMTKETLIHDMVNSPKSAELRDLRAREAAALSDYKLIDEESGRYQIPIERAMELIADEAYQESDQR